MLKKRILASSLASVMALSSVSVVAFADETATAGATEVVTKAELKEYVASFDNFLKDDIYEYGTVQAEQFQDAFDYAENVAASAKATTEEATAAYQMLKAVRESMVQYSAEELQALIDDCTDDYDTENILNEDLGDKIWDQDDYDDFEIAYDEAKKYVDSGDGRLICDLYVELKDAHDGLTELPSVTKADFRNVLREYEAIATKADSYESWRRGKVSVKATTGTTTKNLTKAYFVTFDEINNIVYGDSQDKLVKDKTGALLKNDTTTWIDCGGETDVKTFVEKQYAIFDGIQSSKVTTDEDINAAYAAAKEAVKVFASWKADDTERAAKANIAALVNKYRAQLADDYAQTLIGDVVTSINAITTGALNTYNPGDKKIIAQKDFYLNIVKATGLIAVEDATHYDDSDLAADPTITVKKIGKGQDIMKYIPVDSSLITGGAHTNEAELKLALEIVEAYAVAEATGTAAAFETAYGTVGGDDDLADLDENGIVAKPAGSRNEYTLINRFLTYALADAYPEADEEDTYTKKDVANLIDKAYDLCDETGDAEIFSINHLAVVEGRKDALAWLTAANATKGYTEGDAVNGKTATETYETLEALYDALADQLADYPVSYGEIAEFIADVSSAIDDNVYGASTAKIKEALTKVAFGLSTLDATDDENEAFTTDREFISYNRLYINKDSANSDEKALYADYQALVKAIEDAEKEPETPEVVKGDLTGDGVATPEDAIMIVKAFVGEITLTDAQKAAADFNGDGVVNADDALAVVKAYVGL